MKIKIVVPISGGKDSQACLKLALQQYDKSEVIGLFCDTQFEHPITYAHIDRISDLYGVKIERVCAGNVIDEILSLKNPRFPSGTARFCTDKLKIIPSKKFYKDLAEKQGGFEVWYGMRAEESKDREKRYEGKFSYETYAPHEVISSYPKYLYSLGVVFRLPIIDISSAHVFKILQGEHNPLYNKGFKRVGCFPCLASGDYWKHKAFTFDEFGKSQLEKIQEVENSIGKSCFTSKGNKFNKGCKTDDIFSGCSVCAI